MPKKALKWLSSLENNEFKENSCIALRKHFRMEGTQVQVGEGDYAFIGVVFILYYANIIVDLIISWFTCTPVRERSIITRVEDRRFNLKKKKNIQLTLNMRNLNMIRIKPFFLPSLNFMIKSNPLKYPMLLP